MKWRRHEEPGGCRFSTVSLEMSICHFAKDSSSLFEHASKLEGNCQEFIPIEILISYKARGWREAIR